MADAWQVRYDAKGTAPGWYVSCLSRGVPMRWGAYPTEADAQAVQVRLIAQYQKESAHEHQRPFTGHERVSRSTS